MDKLSKIAAQRAKDELNENEKTKTQKIEKLRQKVCAEKSLNCPTDEAFLLRFLRQRKFDVDKAFQRIVDFYKIRAEHRDIFDDLTPARIKHVLDAGVINILPDRDDQGRKLWIQRLSLFPFGKHDLLDIVRANAVVIDKLLEEEETQICGIRIILDLTGFTFSHATYMTPTFFRKQKMVTQECYPIRMGAFEVINGSTVFNCIFKVASTIMGKKMMSRLRNHESLQSFLDAVCPEVGGQRNTAILPNDPALGGTGDFSLPTTDFYRQLLADEEQFQYRNKHHIVDFTSLGKATKQGVVAGAQGTVGSIRKLEVD